MSTKDGKFEFKVKTCIYDLEKKTAYFNESSEGNVKQSRNTIQNYQSCKLTSPTSYKFAYNYGNSQPQPPVDCFGVCSEDNVMHKCQTGGLSRSYLNLPSSILIRSPIVIATLTTI